MSAALVSLYGSLLFSNPYLADLGRELSCVAENSTKMSERSIVSSNQDPHDFNLKLSDRLRIENAKIFFHLAPNLEHWIPKVKTGFVFKLPQSFQDPHIWHSIEATIQIADQMALRMIQINPAVKSDILKCKNEFVATAKDFESRAKTKFETLASDRKVIAVEHNSVKYLAALLGLKVVSLRGADPSAALSPAEIAVFNEKVKNVTAVFPPNSARAKALARVLDKSKVKLGQPLLYEGPAEAQQPGSTILKMWKYNVDALFAGLSG